MTQKKSKQIEGYYNGYDSLLRFISYFYQTNLSKDLNPRKILEVGIGNKTVSNYLNQEGLNVTTCDLNRKLKPDHIADIRSLPFKENSYDLIIACEVLEHIPWKELKQALKELYRVTKRNAIISVPYSSLSFEIIIKLPFIRRILKRPFLDIFFRIPYFFRKHNFNGNHYWELGKKNYPIHQFRKLLRKRFKIKKEIRPPLNSYHHFFVLEKI